MKNVLRNAYVMNWETGEKEYVGKEVTTTGNVADIVRDMKFEGKRLNKGASMTRKTKKHQRPHHVYRDKVTVSYRQGKKPGAYTLSHAINCVDKRIKCTRRTQYGEVMEYFNTMEDLVAILYMHQSGMTDKSIAETFGDGRTTNSVRKTRSRMVKKGYPEFRRSLKKIDIGHGKWSEEDIFAFKVLWEKGMKLTEISKILDRPYASCAVKRCKLFAEGIEEFAPRRARA